MNKSLSTAAERAPPPGEGPGGLEPAPAYYGLQVLPPPSAVVELGGIVALLLAVDWLWPALDINNLQPSPYWLPVLLLSLQYGTASGSLAVIVAIVAYFAFVTLPEQGVGENEFAYRLRILAQPILWIATAVLLGQFRMVQIAAKRELALRVAELEAQGRTLADYASRLRGRCDALERDIASRALPADARLLEALADLAGRVPAVPGAIERCLSAAFPAAAASLYVRQGTALERLVSTGWPAGSRWRVSLPADHPVTLAVAGTKRRLCVLEAGDDGALAGEGLAAVPVADQRTGRILGLVKIEFAPATMLTPRLVRELDVVAAAIEPLLEEFGGAVRIRLPTVEREAGSGAAQPIPLRQAMRQTVMTVFDTGGAGGGGEPALDLVRPKAGP